ncbi:hypothetical protein [Microbacterium sp. cx-59]|uniref:hypothetical protein n=1 Tax=Microbacterium sp. cx-59 TaxID=2891207 RepID=UPI001E3546CA|nr:hypothetical protein [Microbacterium sp. cx-59]MCC4908468.1 hypothetical protein [Microbacterium sp. cx-59]
MPSDTNTARALASLAENEWGLGPTHALPAATHEAPGWYPYDTSAGDDHYQVESAAATGPLVVVVFRSREHRLVAILTPDPNSTARELFELLWQDMERITPQRVEEDSEMIQVGGDVRLLPPSNFSPELVTLHG